MAKTKYKSAKRFGTRYGRSLRDRLGKIESMQREKHICPYCNMPKVKRMTVGIWCCSKCGAKFTGKAYNPDSKRAIARSEMVIAETKEISEEIEEEISEEE